MLLRLGLSTSGTDLQKYLRLLSGHATIEKAAYQAESNRSKGKAPDSDPIVPASYGSALLLIEALTMRDYSLTKEYLKIIARQKKRVHPWCLPALLEHLIRHPDLASLLHRVGGQRANWLSQHKDTWHWYHTIQGADPSEVPTTLLIHWLHIHSDQPLSSALMESLDLTTRKKVWDFWLANNGEVAIELARTFSDSKSVVERSRCLLILLKYDTEEQDSIVQWAAEVAMTAISTKKSKLNVDIKKLDNKEVPPKLQKMRFNHSMDTPVLSLFALLPAQVLFRHLNLSPSDIVQQLGKDKNSEALYKTLWYSARHPDSDPRWILELSRHWIDNYPKHQTTSIEAEQVFVGLDTKQFAHILSLLIEDASEYFTERLTYLITNCPHYISRDQSRDLMTKLFGLLHVVLSRTEVDFFIMALHQLRYRLDPRIHPFISTHWVEIESSFSKLGDAFWQLRHTINQRAKFLSNVMND